MPGNSILDRLDLAQQHHNALALMIDLLCKILIQAFVHIQRSPRLAFRLRLVKWASLSDNLALNQVLHALNQESFARRQFCRGYLPTAASMQAACSATWAL
jgi:hypothetical protein